MAHEKVSVIIATYNRAEKVFHAVKSVLSQTQPADEVIVVDDGSQDSTQEVLAKFGDSITCNPTTKQWCCRWPETQPWKRQQGLGLPFLDDDDIWYPWKLGTANSNHESLASSCYVVLKRRCRR